jgi:hypothetical protein
MLISGKMSIAMRETAPAASRHTRSMPAAIVNGRFSENSASDIGQPTAGTATRHDTPCLLARMESWVTLPSAVKVIAFYWPSRWVFGHALDGRLQASSTIPRRES